MGLIRKSTKEEVSKISKVVIGMLPYAFLIIASLVFVSSVNDESLLFKIIKVALLILDIFALAGIFKRGRELITLLRK